MANLKNNTVHQNVHFHPGKKDTKILLPAGKVTPVDDKHLEDPYLKSLIEQGILTSVTAPAPVEEDKDKSKGKGKK